MTMVEITKENDKLIAISPYNLDLPKRARAAGGKWNGSAWVFDARDEQTIREIYTSIYGTDGTTPVCDVRLTYCGGPGDEDSKTCEGYYIDGLQVARAFGRDSGAIISEGVVVVSGGFNSSGSCKNWATTVKSDTVLVLRDVPINWANDIDRAVWAVEVIGEIDKSTLEDEKKRLLERLAEIEEMLN